MNPLEKWCEKHELLPAWLALAILPAAEDCLEALDLVRARRDELLDLASVDIERWASFYTNTEDMVGNALAGLFEKRDEGVTTVEEIRKLIADPTDIGRDFAKSFLSEDWKEQVAVARWEYAILVRALLDECTRKSESEIPFTTPPPEMIFFASVAFPCWLHTGRNLQSVCKAAENGDELSAKVLVALDPNVLEVTSIRRSILQQPAGGRRARLNRAMDHGLPAAKRAMVKASFAGIVDMLLRGVDQSNSCLAKKLRLPKPKRFRLLEPDYRELFDALAKCKRGQDAIDEDLHLMPDSLYKAMKRAQKALWKDPQTVGQILF
jgi:hypothetical protein